MLGSVRIIKACSGIVESEVLRELPGNSSEFVISIASEIATNFVSCIDAKESLFIFVLFCIGQVEEYVHAYQLLWFDHRRIIRSNSESLWLGSSSP